MDEANHETLPSEQEPFCQICEESIEEILSIGVFMLLNVTFNLA